MNTDAGRKYQRFKIASEKYGKALNDLEKTELDDVERVAERKIHIEELVLSTPEASKISVSKSQIEEAIVEITQRFENESDLDLCLDNFGMVQDDLEQALMRELHVNSVLDYVSADYEQPTSTDISLFYYMNVGKFNHPEIRTARHILVTVNEDSEENTRTKSFQKINQIASRLDKKPKVFEEQALKHSECPTALDGGLLGQVKVGVLYPELEQVLFSLKPGEISGIVESELGFHILRCDEVKPAGVLSLDEAMPKLKQYLDDRNRKQKQRQWLDALIAQPQDTSHIRGSKHG